MTAVPPPVPLEIVRHVRQEHDYGCGVASLAMITGQTYDDVRLWLLANWPGGQHDHDPGEWIEKRGIYSGIADYFLGKHGYVWRKVYSGWEQQPWPPEPFAPVHLAMVRQPSGNSHYVAMRADGVVLDPLSDEPRRLTDWPQVDNVQGIWHLAAVYGDIVEAARRDALDAAAEAIRALDNSDDPWIRQGARTAARIVTGLRDATAPRTAPAASVSDEGTR